MQSVAGRGVGVRFQLYLCRRERERDSVVWGEGNRILHSFTAACLHASLLLLHLFFFITPRLRWLDPLAESSQIVGFRQHPSFRSRRSSFSWLSHVSEGGSPHRLRWWGANVQVESVNKMLFIFSFFPPPPVLTDWYILRLSWSLSGILFYLF